MDVWAHRNAWALAETIDRDRINRKIELSRVELMEVYCAHNAGVVSVPAVFVFLLVLLEYLMMPYQQACIAIAIDFINKTGRTFLLSAR